MATGSGGGVEILRPGVAVAGAVSERAEGGAQPFVAAPAKARRFAFAGFDRHGGLASVAGERVAVWVAGAAVPDLRQQLGRGDHAVGAFEQRSEDGAVGMLPDHGRELALELLDLHAHRLERRDQRQHQLATGAQLELADATRGRTPELAEQLRGRLPAGVALASQKRCQTRLAQPPRLSRTGVALASGTKSRWTR